MTAHDDEVSTPPVAPRREVTHSLHGDDRLDAYAWMKEVDSDDAMANLAAERAYYDTATAPLSAESARLFEAMSARLALVDGTVARRGRAWAYFSRTPAGGEYEQLCRVPLAEGADVATAAWRSGLEVDSGTAEVLVDPAALIGDSTYVDLDIALVSPNEQLLAYSVDTTGDEVYQLRFRDLATGDDLPDVLPRTYFTGAWSADSRHFFYTVHDELYRPNEVWRHRIGSDPAGDVLVVSEPDERFSFEVRCCRSGDLIEIVTASRDTTEIWVVDSHHPEEPARCVEPRRTGIEYRVEHARPGGRHQLLITTNDGATEYRLMSAPLDTPGREHWLEMLAEDPAERLQEAHAFAQHLVTVVRRDCHLMARAYPWGDDGRPQGPGIDLVASMPAGTLELADNDWFDADHLTVLEQSYTVPKRWSDIDLGTGARTVLLKQDVPAYQSDDYVSEMVWIPVSTGLPWPGDERPPTVEVPVNIVRRADVALDGTAPCLLYGYGAYEACFETEFDAALTVLLDQGVVFAHALIRGGGEGGRRWWLDGKLERKQNTFTDHIEVANALAGSMVDGTRIVTRGLSAGGLLQGVVFNQAPQRWRGVIAEVPFVDVVTTMLDASIPLTVTEWEEWGDPSKPDEYRWLRAYSPYDNPPPAGARPDLLVTGSLHDPRVMVFEPAKWVALLRHTDPLWSARCVFRAELGAGAHVGPSGRYAHLRYESEVYAWALSLF